MAAFGPSQQSGRIEGDRERKKYADEFSHGTKVTLANGEFNYARQNFIDSANLRRGEVRVFVFLGPLRAKGRQYRQNVFQPVVSSVICRGRHHVFNGRELDDGLQGEIVSGPDVARRNKRVCNTERGQSDRSQGPELRR